MPDKERIDLSEYFGAPLEDLLLDQLAADSRWIRELARSRD